MNYYQFIKHATEHHQPQPPSSAVLESPASSPVNSARADGHKVGVIWTKFMTLPWLYCTTFTTADPELLKMQHFPENLVDIPTISMSTTRRCQPSELFYDQLHFSITFLFYVGGRIAISFRCYLRLACHNFRNSN